jgi:transposase
MLADREPLPSDLATAHAMILAERDARREAESRAHNAEAMVAGARLEIERLKLLLAKARRERFGPSCTNQIEPSYGFRVIRPA